MNINDKNNNVIDDSLENHKFLIDLYWPIALTLIGLGLVVLVGYFPPKEGSKQYVENLSYMILGGGLTGAGTASLKNKKLL